MHRISKNMVLLLILLMSLGFPLFAQQEVKIATGEYAPYTSQAMTGKGFFSEIVTASFEAVGITPQYEFYPWARCEYLLENDRVFAIMPYTVTEERKQKYSFSDEVAASTGRFFYLKSRFPQGLSYQEWSDLKDINLGGTRGYWYEETFKKAGLDVDYVSSDIVNLRKLKAGRIDAFVMNELQGRAMIKEEFPGQQEAFGVVEKPADQSWLRLMIAPGYPNAAEITQEFNRGLEIIKKNGTYADILEKYGLHSD